MPLYPIVRRSSSFALLRFIGVLVLLVAWFSASNHCALAIMAGETESAMVAVIQNACCPSTEHDGLERKAPAGVCCKSLRLLPDVRAEKLAKIQDARAFVELVWMALVEFNVAEIPEPAIAEAADPPKLRSFAEAVLQRSLLSHAPPFAV